MRPLASTSGLLFVCSVTCALAGCQPSSQPSSSAADSPSDSPRPAPKPRPERKLDPRISVDSLEAQLTGHVESIGAGFGPGYQPSGFVSVSAAGETVYARGFGHADHAAGTPNTADTPFCIGALTQQFTATAILLLAAAGKLSLDDGIGRHLPEYPSVGASITVHQLLSHTAGLPNYLSDAAVLQRRSESFTPAKLLELFWNKPLEFRPGSDFRHSDSGYAVLGAIIERLSRRSYAEHMEREIFSPFGLERTLVGCNPQGEENARGYSASPSGGLEPARSIDSSLLYAGAGVSSTASDLLLWHDALQNDEVLDPPRQQALFRPVLNQYAYGWFVRDEHGLGVVSHGGAVAGFVSHFARVPELDLALVVLSNNSSVDASPIADAALGAALGEKLEPREAGMAVALDPSVSPRITGTYRLSDAAADELKRRKVPKKALQAMRSVRVYEESGKLYFKPVGQAAVAMIATGRSSFVLRGGQAKIEVALDPDDSPATVLRLEQGTLTLEFTRRARVRGKAQEPEVDSEESTH